jgi:hypothetical protein
VSLINRLNWEGFMSKTELPSNVKDLPLEEKQALAEWLLQEIEDEIPADFWLGLRQAEAGRLVEI